MEISTLNNTQMKKELYYLKDSYIEGDFIIFIVSNPETETKIIRIKKSEIRQ